MKTLLIGINSKYIHPAMGIFQIAKNSNTPILVREFTIKDTIASICDYISHQEFDLLGFSVYIWNCNYVHRILENIQTDKPILLGGPEAGYNPGQFLKYRNVKYIIKCEGETAFNELIDYLLKKRFLNEVSNLYYRTEAGFVYTYDKLPNLAAIQPGNSLIGDYKNRVVYLEASRGCPFHCSYCLASLEKKVRFFPESVILGEIQNALNKPASTVKFLDRSFNANQKFMLRILDYLKKHDNGITVFQFEIVGDRLEEETIRFLQTIRRGQIRFEIGIQSANDAVNQAVHRVQDFSLLKSNIQKIIKNIIIHADLIAGLPYENMASFIESFNQTFRLYCDELQLGFLKELKGTQLSKTKENYGYRFSANPPYEIIENRYISASELEEIRIVEEGLNKYYNSHHFTRTCRFLFQECNLDPYRTFLEIMRFINSQKTVSSIQHSDTAKFLYLSLKDKVGEKLLFYIKQDYLLKDKQKPKIWWESDITKTERNRIYMIFTNRYSNLTMDYLYRYCRLEKYQNIYFIITYNPQNIYFFEA